MSVAITIQADVDVVRINVRRYHRRGPYPEQLARVEVPWPEGPYDALAFGLTTAAALARSLAAQRAPGSATRLGDGVQELDPGGLVADA